MRKDGWNREATPMTRGEYGVWEVTLQAKEGRPAIPHDSKIKVIRKLRNDKSSSNFDPDIYGPPIW